MDWGLIKIIFVFALVVACLFRRLSLNIVMPAAAVLLALLFWLPPLDFLANYGLSLISSSTLELILIMYLIMLLEEVMKHRGYMDRMLRDLDNLFHSKRLNISLLPMLIGFLPSAGGALFSAPMVQEAAQGTTLTPEDKTYFNSLYRHIMELFFPTYPCILLTAELCGIPLYQVIVWLFPIAVLAFLAGLFRMRKLPRHGALPQGRARGKLALALLLTIWPLLALILLILIFQMKVYTAAAIILAALLIVERMPPRAWWAIIKTGTNWRLLLTVAVVMAFKDTLLLCGVAEILPATVARIPIPTFLVFSLIALVMTMMTGMTVATVGIVLPLALAAMPGQPLAVGVLIMCSTFCGNQLTPMRLCITLVANKFQANLRKVLVQSIPTYLFVWCCGIGLYFLINQWVTL